MLFRYLFLTFVSFVCSLIVTTPETNRVGNSSAIVLTINWIRETTDPDSISISLLYQQGTSSESTTRLAQECDSSSNVFKSAWPLMIPVDTSSYQLLFYDSGTKNLIARGHTFSFMSLLDGTKKVILRKTSKPSTDLAKKVEPFGGSLAEQLVVEAVLPGIFLVALTCFLLHLWTTRRRRITTRRHRTADPEAAVGLVGNPGMQENKPKDFTLQRDRNRSTAQNFPAAPPAAHDDLSRPVGMCRMFPSSHSLPQTTQPQPQRPFSFLSNENEMLPTKHNVESPISPPSPVSSYGGHSLNLTLDADRNVTSATSRSRLSAVFHSLISDELSSVRNNLSEDGQRHSYTRLR